MKRNPKSLFKVTTLVAFSAMSLTALAADPASKTEPAEAAAAKQSLLGRGDLHGASKPLTGGLNHHDTNHLQI